MKKLDINTDLAEEIRQEVGIDPYHKALVDSPDE